MSGMNAKRGTVNRKRLTCTNQGKFASKNSANQFINRLRNKGQRGTATLRAYKCAACSNNRGEVWHVGHTKGAN